MEPLTAILLIGIMTVATVKTAGTAVNDGIASARGHTPPTQERWRVNEEKRRERGEKPRKDPGGIRRIWQNQMEYAAEKSAKKHQGRMEYLADHGDEIAAGKRGRMERADRHRQAVGGVLARAGGSSWEAMKTAAQKAAEARRNHAEHATERQAWRENERRDADTAGWVDDDGRGHPRRYSSESGSGWQLPVVYGEDGNPYCVHPDGSWSPYESSSIEAEDAVADGTVVPFDRQSSPEQDDRRWRNDNRNREWATGPQSGPPTTQHNTARGEQAATETDPEHDRVRDPDRPGHTVSVAELQRRREEQSRERQRQHDAAEAQAAREHTERMAGARPANTDESKTEQDSTGSNAESAAQEHQEGTNMPQPQSGSTEITDLTTAQMRAKESQQYAGKVQAVLSDQLASIQAAIAGMQSEAQMQESGSGSLAGEGFTSRITGRFDSGAEKYHNAVAALQKQVTAAQTALEEVETAAAEMKTAAAFFGKQQSLADEVGAAKQDGGVSKRTDFYANSGA